MSRDNTPTLQLKMFWHDITAFLNVFVCLFPGKFILCSNQDDKILNVFLCSLQMIDS